MCKYMTRNDYNKMRLLEGEPVSSLKVGDCLVWNNGSTSEVINIEYTKSGKTAKVTYTYESAGVQKEMTQTLRSNTLMTIKRAEIVEVEEVQQECEMASNEINTESLEADKTSLEVVEEQLGKVYNVIDKVEDIKEEFKQNKNKYRYVLKSTNDSSMRYGVCEICGQHVSEVFHQIEERHYTIDSLNYEGWTQHNCKSYFGHEECLKNKQR